MGTPQSGKLSIHEIVARLKEISERYGEESDGGSEKVLDLCEECGLYATIFFGIQRELIISRVKTICGSVFLTNPDFDFTINIEEDEYNPGEPLVIMENSLGYVCQSEIDTEDLKYILEVAMETVKHNNA